jgi:hypothetical protein
MTGSMLSSTDYAWFNKCMIIKQLCEQRKQFCNHQCHQHPCIVKMIQQTLFNCKKGAIAASNDYASLEKVEKSNLNVRQVRV